MANKSLGTLKALQDVYHGLAHGIADEEVALAGMVPVIAESAWGLFGGSFEGAGVDRADGAGEFRGGFWIAELELDLAEFVTNSFSAQADHPRVGDDDRELWSFEIFAEVANQVLHIFGILRDHFSGPGVVPSLVPAKTDDFAFAAVEFREVSAKVCPDVFDDFDHFTIGGAEIFLFMIGLFVVGFAGGRRAEVNPERVTAPGGFDDEDGLVDGVADTVSELKLGSKPNTFAKTRGKFAGDATRSGAMHPNVFALDPFPVFCEEVTVLLGGSGCGGELSKSADSALNLALRLLTGFIVLRVSAHLDLAVAHHVGLPGKDENFDGTFRDFSLKRSDRGDEDD